MKKSEIIKFLILRTIGNFLVLFAIFGAIATFGPALYYEINFRITEARGVRYVVSNLPAGRQVTNDQIPNLNPQIPNPKSQGIDSFANVLTGAKVQEIVPTDTNFSIVIPRLGASAKVFPNIDPSNQDEFLPVLMKGVAHAKGTVFPGMNGNTYLFAHSTDNFWDVGAYNAIFYLLKNLKPGDDVIIFFENQRFNYVVSKSEIVDPNDISYIVNSKNSSNQTLILQTCWPPGTTFQRLLVLAKPK